MTLNSNFSNSKASPTKQSIVNEVSEIVAGSESVPKLSRSYESCNGHMTGTDGNGSQVWSSSVVADAQSSVVSNKHIPGAGADTVSECSADVSSQVDKDRASTAIFYRNRIDGLALDIAGVIDVPTYETRFVTTAGRTASVDACKTLHPLLAALYVRQGSVADVALACLGTLLKDTDFFEEDLQYPPSDGCTSMLDLTVEAVCDRLDSYSERQHESSLSFLETFIKFSSGVFSTSSLERITRALTFLYTCHSTTSKWIQDGLEAPAKDAKSELRAFKLLKDMIWSALARADCAPVALALPEAANRCHANRWSWSSSYPDENLEINDVSLKNESAELANSCHLPLPSSTPSHDPTCTHTKQRTQVGTGDHEFVRAVIPSNPENDHLLDDSERPQRPQSNAPSTTPPVMQEKQEKHAKRQNNSSGSHYGSNEKNINGSLLQIRNQDKDDRNQDKDEDRGKHRCSELVGIAMELVCELVDDAMDGVELARIACFAQLVVSSPETVHSPHKFWLRIRIISKVLFGSSEYRNVFTLLCALAKLCGHAVRKCHTITATLENISANVNGGQDVHHAELGTIPVSSIPSSGASLPAFLQPVSSSSSVIGNAVSRAHNVLELTMGKEPDPQPLPRDLATKILALEAMTEVRGVHI